MRVAPFLLTFAILAAGMVLAFLQATGSSDEPALVASRPTVTPRPRPTSPSQLAEVVPTQPRGAGLAQSGAAAPPVGVPQQPTTTPSATATASPVPPAQSPTPASTAEPASPTPPVSASATVVQLRVGNTDGQGVFLRRTPRMDDKVRAWMDGTPMEVIGPPVTGEGHTWQHVRAPDGTEGYVPAEYLAGGG